MTRKRETVVLLEELAAIEANVRQMSEQASRSAERYERRVQTGSEVNATDELAERALIDELKAHGDNSRKATLRFTACYGRLLEEGRGDGGRVRGDGGSEMVGLPQHADGDGHVHDRATARGAPAARCNHGAGGGGRPAGDCQGRHRVHHRRDRAGGAGRVKTRAAVERLPPEAGGPGRELGGAVRYAWFSIPIEGERRAVAAGGPVGRLGRTGRAAEHQPRRGRPTPARSCTNAPATHRASTNAAGRRRSSPRWRRPCAGRPARRAACPA